MTDYISRALKHSAVGYAHHKFIYNDNNQIIDFKFLEVNDAYYTLTGLDQSIIGKTHTELMAQFSSQSGNWIELFSSLDTQKSTVSVDYFSNHLNQWCQIFASATEPGFFEAYFLPNKSETYTAIGNEQVNMDYYRNESLIRIMAYKADNMADFLDYALQEAIKLSKSQIGYIYLFDEKTEIFKLNSWSKEVMDICRITEKQTTYELSKTGFWGEVIRQRKPIINNDFEAFHPLKKGFPMGHAPLKRFMSLPIYDKGKIVAVIGLGNKATDYNNIDVYQIKGLLDTVWDVAKRRQAEDSLAQEKEALKITLESIGDGVFTINNLGIITAMNAKGERMTGVKRHDAIGKQIEDVVTIVNANTGDIKADIHDLALLGASYSKMNLDVKLRHQNGTEIFISDNNKPLLNDSGQLIGAVIVFRDITEERQRSEEIVYMNYHDVLTGLYNRRFFEEELRRLDTSRQLPLSIIMGDVNGLKLTNDVFGHAAGDKLLVDVGNIIKKSCRTEDIIARWGGDEFVLLLPQTSSETAEKICQKIRRNMKAEHNSVIDASIALGYATKDIETQSIQKTINLAEDYMYKHKLTESKSQRSNLISAIQHSLDERNHETEVHAERLVKYCSKVGKKLNLSDEELDNLKLLAVLHDIGKIGIPDQILLKPGPLNDEEWHVMKKHPEIGYRIAKSSPDLNQIADYILTHHEKYDGSGYPHSMYGEQIPLASRILAVADAYDAMTSDRPYRAAMTDADALQELKDYAGTQFDPMIVSIFAKLLQEDQIDR